MNVIDRVIYRAWHSQSEKGVFGYVGHSKYGLEHRKKQHEKNALNGRHLTQFIRALKKYNFDLWTWDVVESGISSDKEMKESEIKWISILKTRQNGYNCTSGGDGLCNPTDYVRKKMSDSRRGQQSPRKGAVLREDTKLKIRNALLGRPCPMDVRQKLSDALKGRKLSIEARRKLSVSAVGTRVGMLGKHHSFETKKRMSDAQRGSLNHAYGKQTWITGKKHTEETKLKMRMAWIKRKAKEHHHHESII